MKALRFLSFILALCFIFTSCGTDKSNNKDILYNHSKPSYEYKDDFSNYNLNNFPYKRTNYDEILQDIKPYLSMIIISENEYEALINAKKVLNEIQKADCNRNIIFSRYILNPDDIFNRTEVVYHINNLFFMDSLKSNFSKAIENSPHKSFIKDNLSVNENIMSDLYSFKNLNLEDSMVYYNAIWKCFNEILFENSLSEINRKNLLKIIELNSKKAIKNDFSDFCQMNISFKPYSIKEVDMLIRYVKEYILPVFQKYISKEKFFFNEEKTSFNYFEDFYCEFSDFSNTMINSSKDKNIFTSNEKLNFPVSFFISCFSCPFICFSTCQNSDINRIIGKNTFSYCGGIPFGVQSEICGFCFDALSNNQESYPYALLKKLCFFSFLSEFYKYIYEENNLNENKIKFFFLNTANQYFGNNYNFDKLFDYSLIIICLSQSSPFDFLIASQASSQLFLINKNDNLLAQSVFSSFLVNYESKDIKRLFYSVGFESPFNSQNIKNMAIIFDKILTEYQKVS